MGHLTTTDILWLVCGANAILNTILAGVWLVVGRRTLTNLRRSRELLVGDLEHRRRLAEQQRRLDGLYDELGTLVVALVRNIQQQRGIDHSPDLDHAIQWCREHLPGMGTDLNQRGRPS